jgi:predicted phosphohydrolase
MNIYYLAFHYQFVKDEASSNALLKMVEDERKRKNMFFDPFMGLANPDTMENWVRLGLEGHDFGVAG